MQLTRVYQCGGGYLILLIISDSSFQIQIRSNEPSVAGF